MSLRAIVEFQGVGPYDCQTIGKKGALDYYSALNINEHPSEVKSYYTDLAKIRSRNTIARYYSSLSHLTTVTAVCPQVYERKQVVTFIEEEILTLFEYGHQG
jgi:hypothetical protein